nr:MAG: RNA-dependent RNA polymerase [Riboviria sp.]
MPCNQVTKVLLALCESVGTPRAQTVYMLARAGDLQQLQKLAVQPSHYFDSESLWKDLMVTEFLRKAEIDGSEDLEKKAIESFFELERENRFHNTRLRKFAPSKESRTDWGFGDKTPTPAKLHVRSLSAGDWAVLDFISEVRKEVSSIVGKLPEWLTPRFSPGATMSDKSVLTTIPDKMSSKATYYHGTEALLKFWDETSWAEVHRGRFGNPVVCRSNGFFTVPKDSSKRRGCAKEASINVTLQLDVGRLLKARLKTIGVDLIQGKPAMRECARIGSLTGKYATIDLSNASDTICKTVVELLFPSGWQTLLNSLRATHTDVDGKLVYLEKFSSMGNGFTFELETVVFASIARTMAKQYGYNPDEVRVYGDDIIVESDLAVEVMAALKLFGFTPNTKKTFWEGPFRESCGGDFFSGTPVRAHYVKKLPDEPQKWIAIANGLRRVCAGSEERFNIVRRAWRICQDFIPTQIRKCRGPAELGDIVIHDSEEFWTTRPRACMDVAPGVKARLAPKESAGVFDTLQVRSYVPVPVVLPWHHWFPNVQLASCTLGVESVGLTPRGGVSGFVIRWTDVPGSSWLPS